ncbi:MAG: hypothetical protein E7368_00135, partial [Clostridiales bacterium]|nr:hypothetical protein [Clostridiales bacterium]
MKEQKNSAWYARINKKKIGALLLSACMLGSFVGCSTGSNTESLNSTSNPFYQGAGETNGSLGDYENGNPVGGSSSSGGNVSDYETEDVVSGTTTDKTTEDFETETPNMGDTTTSTGKWEDYVGDEDESVYLQTKLNDDPYRTQGGYSYFYHYQHGPTTMPISAWSPPPPNFGDFTTNQITLANYQKMADAGFNTAYGLYEVLRGVVDVDKRNVTNALTYADQVGMVYYVKDSSALGNLSDNGSVALDNYYSWYMNRKAYGGTLTEDEPGME